MLNATNELVAADAAADNNSNSSSDDISDMTSHSHALIDSDSPAQILRLLHAINAHVTTVFVNV